MAPHITYQTILIPATRSNVVEQGLLIFAEDVLMAAVIHLDGSLGEELAELRGCWFLETGYRVCEELPGTDRLFQPPEEAQQWVLERVREAPKASEPPRQQK